MTGQLRAFGLLAIEALRDAVRRRLVIAIAVLTSVFLYGVQRCASSAELVVAGTDFDPDTVNLLLGSGLFFWLSLAVVNLAGLLATDSLAEPISDRSVVLWLARPVSRNTYATARLAGVLILVVAAAIALLGGVTFFLRLHPLPVGIGAALCLLGCVPVACFAMGIALWVPRIVSALLSLVAIQVIVAVNVAVLIGWEPEGWPLWLDRLAPPLGHGISQAVLLWNPDFTHLADPANVALRLAVWAGLSVALLLLAFRRLELPKT